jgi:hypothetical protein
MELERKKELVRRLGEAINDDNAAVLDEVCTERLATELRRWFAPFRAGFPDWRQEIVELWRKETPSWPDAAAGERTSVSGWASRRRAGHGGGRGLVPHHRSGSPRSDVGPRGHLGSTLAARNGGTGDSDGWSRSRSVGIKAAEPRRRFDGGVVAPSHLSWSRTRSRSPFLTHRDGRPRRRGAAASATAWGSMPSVERRARVNNSLSV